MIGVVDVGMGNMGSLLNMLDRVGAPARAVTRSDEVAASAALILPGVGAFDHGMARLQSSGLIPAIEHHARVEKRPLLGICLGMQLLGRASEEGSAAGLGFIAATTRRLTFEPADAKLRLPHMGWNECRPAPGAKLIPTGGETPRFYFVHSYHVVCDMPDLVDGTAHYGQDFTAAVRHGNIFGVQFHPEKSHRWGKELLARFAAFAR